MFIQQLGVYLAISTMAAAALGNLISDVAGVGLAHYVEILIHKCGFRSPVLSSEQLETPKVGLERLLLYVKFCPPRNML